MCVISLWKQVSVILHPVSLKAETVAWSHKPSTKELPAIDFIINVSSINCYWST